MNDDPVSTALKSLPREQASLGFTNRVLRRIEEAPPRILPAWRANRWIGVAATAVLILALGLSWRTWQQYQTAQHLQVLLVEKLELEAELEALRRLTAEARPMVYLGSDRDVDLVLDLARFKRQGGFGSKLSTTVLPTSAGRRSADPRVEQVGLRGEQVRGGQVRSEQIRPLRVVY